MPPPAIPITNIDDPVFVNFPKSASAKGQMAGQSNELAKPNEINRYIAIEPGNNTIKTEAKTPSNAHIFIAFTCETN